MKNPGRTPPFRDRNGAPVTDSVAEVNYLRLGGVDQWVMIRGAQLANPPLILLHGGPGFSDTVFVRHYNAALERSYTIVYWDQRGTGKSFDRHIPKASMTVEQFLTDLDQLVNIVRARVKQDRVTLLGHSWGSIMGVLYAARFPQKVAAYVGAAQVGDARASEAASYKFAVAEAQRLKNRKALEALQAIGPPPYGDATAVFTERTWIQRLTGELSARALWRVGRMILGTPESSIFDLPNVIRGFRFSLDAMWPEVSQVNLFECAPALEVPVFFIVGRRDHWVPPETSAAYFDALLAPSKKLFWFEHSGHEAFVDEPERFNRVMNETVRPVALAATTTPSRAA